MGICISPDSWTALPVPTNMTVYLETPAVRYEEVSGLYRLKGSFITVNVSIPEYDFDGELPSGFAPAWKQAYRYTSPRVGGSFADSDVGSIVFDTDGRYSLDRMDVDETVAFDGITLL